MKHIVGDNEVAKLNNESIQNQDSINGIYIMVESLRFEGEQVKKKQVENRKELMQEIELIRKDLRQGGGAQKFSGTKKQLGVVNEDPEKKEEQS